MRNHCERNAVRAGVGGLRHARVFQYHAFAGEDLRQRGGCPGSVFPVGAGRCLRDLVPRSWRQIPETIRRDPAAHVSGVVAIYLGRVALLKIFPARRLIPAAGGL